EAKANREELLSDCKAQPDSLETIQRTLDATKSSLGVSPNCNWISGYYQRCNRLAALHTMNTHNAPARLIYIYFYGDEGGDEGGWQRNCPRSAKDWENAIDEQERHVGLPSGHDLEDRIHKLFVNVCCPKLLEEHGEVFYYTENGQKKDAELWQEIL